MSRLDSFIRRLEAQRACLDHAIELVRDRDGAILELGLGNGRTYDHLRTHLPGRDIFVFERRVAAHPDCVPPPGHLILGDLRETLRRVHDRLAGRAALAHVDIGTGDTAASAALAADVIPLLKALLRPGAIVVSEPPLSAAALDPLPLPAGVAAGRYHLYRAPDARAVSL